MASAWVYMAGSVKSGAKSWGANIHVNILGATELIQATVTLLLNKFVPQATHHQVTIVGVHI